MLTLLDFDKFKHLLDVHNALFKAIVTDDFNAASAITESHINTIFDEITVLRKEHEAYFINEL